MKYFLFIVCTLPDKSILCTISELNCEDPFINWMCDGSCRCANGKNNSFFKFQSNSKQIISQKSGTFLKIYLYNLLSDEIKLNLHYIC